MSGLAAPPCRSKETAVGVAVGERRAGGGAPGWGAEAGNGGRRSMPCSHRLVVLRPREESLLDDNPGAEAERGGKGAEEDDEHELEDGKGPTDLQLAAAPHAHLDRGVTACRPLCRCGPHGRPPPRPLLHDATVVVPLHLGAPATHPAALNPPPVSVTTRPGKYRTIA
jgi:hypothetical protein